MYRAGIHLEDHLRVDYYRCRFMLYKTNKLNYAMCTHNGEAGRAARGVASRGRAVRASPLHRWTLDTHCTALLD
ncbi:hypothetical protein B5X24_HaOG211457 [Helicoverpa armigera]|nr:hypothetical protein B5X24_HaOG211457 [Helicoverpa armigera]